MPVIIRAFFLLYVRFPGFFSLQIISIISIITIPGGRLLLSCSIPPANWPDLSEGKFVSRAVVRGGPHATFKGVPHATLPAFVKGVPHATLPAFVKGVPHATLPVAVTKWRVKRL